MNQNMDMLTRYYGERIILIKRVVEEVAGIMEEYRNTREGALKDLGGILVKKSLRRTDFANMMDNLIKMQSNREEEVREILREFLEETEHIESKLKSLLKEPDVKKFKKFIAEVQARQEKKKIEIGKMIEQRLDDAQYNMQAFLEEFKDERVALNLEWEKLNEGKERLGHTDLLSSFP